MRSVLLICIALSLSVAPVSQAAMVCCVQQHLEQSSAKHSAAISADQRASSHCAEHDSDSPAAASSSMAEAQADSGTAPEGSACPHTGACSMGLAALAHDTVNRLADSHALNLSAPAAIGQPLRRAIEIDHPPSIS